MNNGNNPWGDSKSLYDVILSLFKGNNNKQAGGKDDEAPFKTNIPKKKKSDNKIELPYILIIAVLLGGWLATGFYIVAPDEQAVVKRFGDVVDITMPGPHYHLPFPIESVDKAEVTKIHRIELGFYEGRNGQFVDVKEESQMLTGDENIVSLELIVQYQINHVADYLYNVQNVNKTIKDAVQSAIREVAGKEVIDELLTVGKNRVQTETQHILQDMLNSYKAGVRIVAVQLLDVAPPEAVSAAFKDVASAREDKNRFINEAEAYANQVIPQARGAAETMIQQADGYHAKVVEEAHGDASRFDQILQSYRQSPDITRKRMYIEAMEATLSNSKVKIFDKNIDTINPFIGMTNLSNEVTK